MVQAREHIDIYGGPAQKFREEKFREIREDLEQRWGSEPPNRDVISLL